MLKNLQKLKRKSIERKSTGVKKVKNYKKKKKQSLKQLLQVFCAAVTYTVIAISIFPNCILWFPSFQKPIFYSNKSPNQLFILSIFSKKSKKGFHYFIKVIVVLSFIKQVKQCSNI